MAKDTALIMIFGLYLFFNVDLAMPDTIELKDNRVYKVDCYWEKDGRVFYQKHGTEVSFEKSQIKKIIDESGPAPKIVYRDGSAENKSDLIQIQKKEYAVKSHKEQIVEGLLKKNQEPFPPRRDFEYKGTRYKYINPGVYQTENGDFYNTTTGWKVDGEPFPPRRDFEYNGTRYEYISPGVYQTENGTVYKATGVSGANDNRSPPKKYFEYNGRCYEIIGPGVYEERERPPRGSCRP
jgi:hypothetical protein